MRRSIIASLSLLKRDLIQQGSELKRNKQDRLFPNSLLPCEPPLRFYIDAPHKPCLPLQIQFAHDVC